LSNPERCAQVAAQSKSLAMPDATRKIALAIGARLRKTNTTLVR
jgi:hypothetical protein